MLPVEGSGVVAFERVSHCDQGLDSGRAISARPICEESDSNRIGGLLPDLTEIFIQIVALAAND